MSIKRIFIAMTAIFAASAVFADNSSVTSKKYVDDLMSGYQDKLPGSGANTLMIYDDETGIGEKSIETTLVSNATGVPTVGAVKDGLDDKQDTITGTAGYVMTGTSVTGNVGERPIYGTSENYAHALVTAETVNTGVINAVNSSLIRVDENGAPSDSGTLWEISDDLIALSTLPLPTGYTQLEYIGTNHNAYIMTNFTVNDFDRVVADIKLYDNDTERSSNDTGGSSQQFPHLFGVSADASSGSVQAKVFRFFNPSVSSMYAAYNDKWASSWGGIWAPQSVPLNTWHKFDIKLADGEQYIKMDTSVIATGTKSSTMVNSYKLPIFAMSYAGDIKYIPHLDSKIIKMYLGNTLVANLVPAKNSSGVVGMYDTVSGQFFPDAAGGNFTAGPSCISPNLYGGKYYKILVVSSTAYSPVEIQGDTWTADGVRRGIAKIIPVSGNTTYTFSVAGTQNVAQRVITEYASIEDMSAATNAIATQGGAVGNLTFTTNANTKYLLVGVWAYPTPSAGTVVSITDPQLEKGSTATSYRPYGENICD